MSAEPAAPGASAFALQSSYGAPAGMPAFLALGIQRKLSVGAVDDPLERKADRVAEQVMSRDGEASPPHALTAAPQVRSRRDPALAIPAVRRKCACKGPHSHQCEECRLDAGDTIARKALVSGNAHATSAMALAEVLRSPGQPLELATRTFVESRFDRDFSGVRVHTDSAAEHSARAVNARAYTTGGHVVFAKGEYAPHLTSGMRLLAHELAHVVQQSHNDSSYGSSVRSEQSRVVLRQANTPDPDKFDRCKDLLDSIKETVATLLSRTNDLLTDPLGLQWDNWNTPKILPDGTNVGSVEGHKHQYEGLRNRLRNQIDEWNDDDCNSTGLRITREARDLVFTPAPDPLPRPRPDTAPRPWNAPGTAPARASARAQKPQLVCPGGPHPHCMLVSDESQSEDEGLWEHMSKVTGLTGIALALYLILSEGSRIVFPPRNIIPAP